MWFCEIVNNYVIYGNYIVEDGIGNCCDCVEGWYWEIWKLRMWCVIVILKVGIFNIWVLILKLFGYSIDRVFIEFLNVVGWNCCWGWILLWVGVKWVVMDVVEVKCVGES